jgi:hypothetical protein
VIDDPVLLSLGPQLFMVAKFSMKEARPMQQKMERAETNRQPYPASCQCKSEIIGIMVSLLIV